MLKSCLSFLLFVVCSSALAQSPDNTVNLYGLNFPLEKIHVHFDKESYLPGETIWFKGYIFEDYLPSQRSNNFYIGLYDEKGKLISQNIQPIFGSTTDGSFKIPDSLDGRQVICRAYTGWMLNFDTSFLFTKSIPLIGSAAIISKAKIKQELQFFPEGGDIVEGERNTIAFKASYSNGLPFALNGIIRKQQTGEQLAEFNTMHDGMGRFDLEVAAGERYYAEWKNAKGEMQQTQLPVAKASAVSLKMTELKNKIYYNVANRLLMDSLHVLAIMFQKVVYKADLRVATGERLNGIIPLDNLPAGILQLSVFNQSWQPVAERICFINNNNYSSNATLSIKNTSTQRRGKNELEITVGDTLFTNLSLAVTDADVNNAPSATIINSLLINGDIRGYIHNPGYYFEANTPESKQALDLVMLTHGWRRYNWDDIMARKMPEIKFPADHYLTLFGKIGNPSSIDKGEMINLMVKTKDSATAMYMVPIAKDGSLQASDIVFFDTAKVYYSFNKGKNNNRLISFSAGNNTLPSNPFINNYESQLLKDTAGMPASQQANLFKYYLQNEARTKSAGAEKTLQAVTVKSSRKDWRNDPLRKMDEKYSTGIFSGGATGYNLDLVHDERAENSFDIFNYVLYNIPGMVVNYSGGGGAFNAGKTLTHSYYGTPTIYIDEMVQDASALQNFSISQIAYIKFIPRFVGNGAEAGRGALGPALAIYTRKGDDINYKSLSVSDLGRVSVAGYTPVKEFYAPDYSVTPNSNGTDARTTLLWQPYILMDKLTRKIPITFYNNDFTKRIRVILEGMDESGKLVHIEKVIE